MSEPIYGIPEWQQPLSTPEWQKPLQPAPQGVAEVMEKTVEKNSDSR